MSGRLTSAAPFGGARLCEILPWSFLLVSRGWQFKQSQPGGRNQPALFLSRNAVPAISGCLLWAVEVRGQRLVITVKELCQLFLCYFLNRHQMFPLPNLVKTALSGISVTCNAARSRKVLDGGVLCTESLSTRTRGGLGVRCPVNRGLHSCHNANRNRT